jgi:asparagine synthase (glutamine-hydrolysing)
MGSAFLGPQRPAWVDQLLSPESLAATGYFDAAAVNDVCAMQRNSGRRPLQRFAFDMGLAGVISTQLWHHLYFGGGLCELPVWSVTNSASELTGVSSLA